MLLAGERGGWLRKKNGLEARRGEGSYVFDRPAFRIGLEDNSVRGVPSPYMSLRHLMLGNFIKA